MSGLFDEILEETAKCASVSVASIPVSSNSVKRWSDIAAFWKSNPLFEDAISRAVLNLTAEVGYARSEYKIKNITKLITTAIVTEDDAIAAWENDTDFKYYTRIYRRMLSGPFWYSSEPDENYRSCLFLNSITYRKYTSQKLDVKKLTPYGRKKWKESKRMMKYCGDYEECMGILIPCTKKWRYDRKVIFKESIKAVKRRYNKDYSQDEESLRNIIRVMMCQLNNEPYGKFLFKIKDIPTAIADLLWPGDMVAEIVNQFNSTSIISRNMGSWMGIYCDIVSQSWAYKLLYERVLAKDHPAISDDVRKRVFEVGLGVV